MTHTMAVTPGLMGCSTEGSTPIPPFTARPRPVVLIHGVGLDRHMWDPLASLLHRPIITYDLLGMGDAAKPPGPYSLALYADQLLSLTNGRRVDIVGFSLGALIAQRFAIDHPELVHRLVLVSGVFNRSPEERSAIQQRVAEVRSGAYLQSVEPALARWFTVPFAEQHPEVVDTIRTRMRANDPIPYSHAYAVFAEGDNELAHAACQISAPTLVVTGGADERSTPAMARHLADRIPGAQVEVIEGVKHLLPLEKPSELASAIVPFLSAEDSVL